MKDVSTQGMRTREIEEVTNLYVIHPASRFCVRHFARWGVHPNAVSVAGMVLGAGAAAAYYHYAAWPMAALGFALMLGWHVMDGADGQLARLTGKTSEIGKVLDGLCDHGTFTLVYAALAVALTPALGGGVWVLAALAGASHLVQASAYEFQRQAYDYWVHGKASARIVAPAELREEMRSRRGAAAVFGRLLLWYTALQHRFAGVDDARLRRLDARIAAGDHDVRDAYRTIHAAGVRRWALLCSNYRTVAIFAACLAGFPAAFFVFEIVVLNAVLVGLTRMQHRNNARLDGWLAAHAVRTHAA